jgi:hypothetical protein
MKKEEFLKIILFVFCLFVVTPGFAKKAVFVEASKFANYFPKDGAKELSLYRYDSNRQLIVVVTFYGDSLISIRCNNKELKKEKKLLLKRDVKNPSNFYCLNWSHKKQKEFDLIIEKVLSILNKNI